MTDKKPLGRPRSHPPEFTDSDRSAAARQYIISQGGRNLQVMLMPEVNQALQYIRGLTGETMTATVSRLLLDEAKKIREEK